MITCPSCGTANRDTAHFCQDCAAPLSAERVCPNCGVSNSIQARFCLNCATALQGDTPPAGLTGRLPPNTVLSGRYSVIRKLGRGGRGAVSLVNDTRLGGKHWAVKEMSDAALVDPQERQNAVQAFQSEATLLASMNHPNLTKVVDYFEEGAKHYLVMDYIDGQTLDELLAGRTQPFTEERVTDWALQLCDVLDYLHNQPQPVIFRDLKPGNIMLDKDGQIHLIDFGIARLFKPGKSHDTASFGTAGYAPREQYGRGQTDARSDVYALGATLHHLLTLRDPGDEPFKFPQANALNPNIPDQLNKTVMSAVEQEPEDRWQSAKEFAQALAGAQTPAAQPALNAQVSATVATQPVVKKRSHTPKQIAVPNFVRSLKSIPPMAVVVGGAAAVLLLVLAVLLLSDSFPDIGGASALIPGKSSYSVLFTSNRHGKQEIYRLDEEGRTIRVTNTRGDFGSWSPIRTPAGRILFTSNRDGKREIYRIEDSGEVTRVTHTPGRAESWSPSISPAGKILFISNRDGKREIYRLDESGTTARVTHTAGDYESWSPAISPAGKMLFVSNRDGKREIYRLEDSSGTVRVTHTPGDYESWSPSISPGGRILFVSNRDGKREIYRLDESGNTVRVTNTPGHHESWSPDPTPGGNLLFTTDRDGKREIYRLEETGDVIRVTNTPGQYESWTSNDD